MDIKKNGLQASYPGPAVFHRHRTHRPMFKAPDQRHYARRQRHVRAGRAHRLAYASARPDADYHVRLGSRAALGRSRLSRSTPATWSGSRRAKSTGTAHRPPPP